MANRLMLLGAPYSIIGDIVSREDSDIHTASITNIDIWSHCCVCVKTEELEDEWATQEQL